MITEDVAQSMCVDCGDVGGILGEVRADGSFQHEVLQQAFAPGAERATIMLEMWSHVYLCYQKVPELSRVERWS